MSQGKRVGIHCRASIGRSSVTTASLLIRSGVSISGCVDADRDGA